MLGVPVTRRRTGFMYLETNVMISFTGGSTIWGGGASCDGTMHQEKSHDAIVSNNVL